MPLKKTKIKIQPTVVIGLGGTGMNTITRLKRRAVEEFGDPLETTCPQLRFLLIDTDDPEETLRSEQKNIDVSTFKITPNEFLKATAIDISEDKIKMEPSVRNWFPDDKRLYAAVNDFEKGARAVKALGRLAFFWNSERIRERLPQLFNIPFKDVQDQNGNVERNFSVYVVGSLSGGTGAGMFLDMGYMLKKLHEDGDINYPVDIRGLFVLGELHSQEAGNRTVANTYASLKELNYYMRDDIKYTPYFMEGKSQKISQNPYDLVYLFGKSNRRVNFTDVSQLTEMLANFIFIDSSTGVAEHIWRYRVNKSHYTAVIDDNGTPFCYSSMGLCIIRFPWQQILDLCAQKFAQKVVQLHFLRPDEPKIHDVRTSVTTFMEEKGLVCDKESRDKESDLSRKLISMGGEDEQAQLDRLISIAFEEYSDNLKDINPLKQTNHTLKNRIKQLKTSIDDYVSQLLTHTKEALKTALKEMIRQEDRGGLIFAIEFCNELHEACQKANEFAQKELKSSRDREARLGRDRIKNVKDLQDILASFSLFKRKAIREQLKISLNSMKKVFLNELFTIRYGAVNRFMEALLDSHGRIRNEGFMPFLTREIEKLEEARSLMDRIHREMGDGFERQRTITSSTFDQVVYDNETNAEFHDVYDPVDEDDSMLVRVARNIIEESTRYFEDVEDYLQSELGLSIYNLQGEGYRKYLEIFLEACREPFINEIDRYSVEDRINMSIERGGPNYLEKMSVYYDFSQHYAVFDQAVASLARFDGKLQTLFMIGIEDKDKSELPEYFQEHVGLRAGERTGNFITTRDRHQIVIFREVHGFPAYMMKSCRSYLNKYTAITKNPKEAPLQLVSLNLVNYEPPVEKVIFNYEKQAIKGAVLGVIIYELDENKQLVYKMIDMDERRRRKAAMEKKSRQKQFKKADLTCGLRLDTNLDRSISDKIQRHKDPQTDEKYIDMLQRNIADAQKQIELCQPEGSDVNEMVNLLTAFYHELPLPEDDPYIDRREIRRIIEKILWTEYRIEEVARKSEETESYAEILARLGL